MYLGVEIGGTKLQVGVGDAHGRIKALERRRVERRTGARGILRQIEEVAPALIARYRVRAIGVGFGGPVDLDSGRVVTSHQIAGWDRFPLRRWFVRQFGLPTVVENDQNAAALAEARGGAGRGKRRVFYVTVGTGVGGGLVVDGQIYNGRYGASEIGHTRCGLPATPAAADTKFQRSLEKSVSLPTLEDLASGLAIEHGVSTVEQAGTMMGVALANAIALLNPEVVIVGGGVTRAGARFWRPLRQTVARLVFRPFRRNYRIVRPVLGEGVVVVGAVLLAARARARVRAGAAGRERAT